MYTGNAQCLIFVPSNKRRRVAKASGSLADQPEIRGYVLIQEPFVSAYPEVVEFFSYCDMQIITGHQDCTNFQTALKNQRFGIFEVQLEHEWSFSSSEPRRVKKTRSRNIPGPFCIRVYGADDREVAQRLLRVSENDVFCFGLYFKDRCDSAINEHNLKVLKNVLPHKVDVDNLHGQGGTILHFAARIGEAAFVDLLLEKKCPVNAKGPDGLTPLHVAAKHGYLEIVESLLQHGADANARASFKSFKDCTPLVLSVRHEHLDVCKALLNNGSDVDVIFDSDQGTSILELAVKQTQHLEFVEAILEFKPDVNAKSHWKALLNALCYEKQTIFPFSSKNVAFRIVNYNETVKKLLQYGFSVDIEHVENLSELLFGAVHKNCFEIVQMCLGMGVNVNELHNPSFSNDSIRSYTPLHIAVMAADEDIVRVLIDQGADANTQWTYEGHESKVGYGHSSTVMAIQCDRLNIVKLLLMNGVNVRSDPNVMREAALANNLDIIKVLLLNGAPLNSGHPCDLPVYMAACEGNMELLEVLFNYGARLSLEYDYEEPSLFRYSSKQPSVLRFIMDQNFTNTHFIRASGMVQFFSSVTDACNNRRLLNRRDDEDYRNEFKSSANIIARHIIKQESANLFVCDQNVERIWYSHESIDDFRSACEAESTKMKQEKVCGNIDDESDENETTVTFYDITTQSVKQVAGYAKNQTVVKAMETESYEARFPIFAGVMKCQFKKGHHRAKLVKQGIKSANHLFKNCRAVASKEINMELILNYLSNRDLLSLNNVFPVSMTYDVDDTDTV